MTTKPQRLVFGETLVELGAENPRVVVLDADVSSSTQTKHFAAAYPDRFFNVGIAEGNMASVAAGLAASGHIPCISTFALFMALKAGDQIRAQIAYPSLHVILAGGYAGFSDFADGASHQSVEDLAVMRAIPNITVIAPSDITETRMAVRAAAAHDGPVYLRLSRDAVPTLYQDDHPFEIGKGVVLEDGTDITIVATGTMVATALAAHHELQEQGINARVIDMHTVKPLDTECIAQAARDTGALVTIEEHNIIGGLGSAVCEAVTESCPVSVTRIGIPDRFGESGAYPEILARAGLDTTSVVSRVAEAVGRKAEVL